MSFGRGSLAINESSAGFRQPHNNTMNMALIDIGHRTLDIGHSFDILPPCPPVVEACARCAGEPDGADEPVSCKDNWSA